jgi:endonuclease G
MILVGLGAGSCASVRPAVETPGPALAAAPTPPQPLLLSVHLARGPSSCNGRLLDRAFYVVCHAGEWRIPRWVLYHLRASDLTPAVSRQDHFRADPALTEEERAELEDYRGSGFSRGHMAPADDFLRSFEAMDATFLLSNMAPQLQGLNGGRWRVLESEVQSLAANHGSIWVMTGPLFLDPSRQPVPPGAFLIGERVAIPTDFFKAVLCEHANGEREMFAFLVPHQTGLPGPTLRYAVSVDSIEELTGLDFFSLLSEADQQRLEAEVTSTWPIP